MRIKRSNIMGAGGTTNHGTYAIIARRLEKTGKPNSKMQKYNNNNQLVQERWYDENGHAVRNRDYRHGGNMKFPHDHDWVWENETAYRLEDHIDPDFEKYR